MKSNIQSKTSEEDARHLVSDAQFPVACNQSFTSSRKLSEPVNKPSEAFSISVIIPVHRGGEKFLQCLTSVIAANPGPDEIIVVFDGKSDTQLPLYQHENITIIHSPERRGPAHARNLGAKHAQGNILFFLDADVTIPHDAITTIKALFRNDPALTAVIGGYDDAPAEKNFLSQYRNLLHHYVHQTSDENASTFWGACGIIRKNVFLEMHGFNASMYDQPAIEDIELGYRLKNAGHKIRLCKDLQIKHLKHWNTLTLLKTDFFHRALPWTRLILQHGKLLNDLNTDTKNRFSVTLTFCLLLLLIFSFIQPYLMALISPVAAALFLINADLYRFFFRKRGFWFTMGVIPWHWLFFFYSGLAFGIGVIHHYIRKFLFNRFT